MKINIEEARQICLDALLKKGVSKSEAEIVVEEYIESDLEGVKSHGLISFPILLEQLKTIDVPRGVWNIKKESCKLPYAQPPKGSYDRRNKSNKYNAFFKMNPPYFAGMLND